MKKWFKILGISVAVVLVLSAIAGVALAQGPVDEDGDGLCDECGEELGDGLMRGRSGTDAWRGEQSQSAMPCDDFVDEDGDGVCDLCGAAYEGEMRGPQYGQNEGVQGVGRGLGDGEQDCDDFVDQDGDGVCDNEGQYAARPFSGRGGRGGTGNWTQGQGRNRS